MASIKQIEDNPVYKEVLKDSFGGVMYNVANKDKYDKSQILELWNSLKAVQKESAGGIMKGVIHFLQNEI